MEYLVTRYELRVCLSGMSCAFILSQDKMLSFYHLILPGMGLAHNRLTDGNCGNLGQVTSDKSPAQTHQDRNQMLLIIHTLLPFSLTTGMRRTKYKLFHLIAETGFMLTRMGRRRNRLSRNENGKNPPNPVCPHPLTPHTHSVALKLY